MHYIIQPLTFVLVHGSWADASFWNGIAFEFSKMGHRVYTPEYPGHGSDPNTNVTHAMITKAVADFIVGYNLRDIVLVGHSFGGSVIQKTAERVPDRIKRLVFMNGFVVGDGQSVADQFPLPVQQAFVQLRQSSATIRSCCRFLYFANRLSIWRISLRRGGFIAR